MTDNEIIEALDCCERCGKCHRCPLKNSGIKGCMFKVMHEALGLINRQKAEIERLKAAPNWISVEDGAPKVGQNILAYAESQNKCFVVVYSDTYRTFFSGQFPVENITHWMPLPAPPKEDK